jgi:hypothetical protein
LPERQDWSWAEGFLSGFARADLRDSVGVNRSGVIGDLIAGVLFVSRSTDMF